MIAPLAGFKYFFEGFVLITKPGIKRFVVVPLIINIILFSIFFMLLRYFVDEFNVWLTQQIPLWLQWLGAITWLIFISLFIIFFIYSFITIANLIAAPFNSLLSEKIQIYLTGQALPTKNVIEMTKDMPRSIVRQFIILKYYLPRALLLVVLFFIPIVQGIAPLCWFIFSSWYMTLTFIDYPTENNNISISEVREQLSKRRWLTLCFGSAVVITSMIPIMNFFLIPAAVAGATKMWEIEFKKYTQSRA